MLEPLPGSRLRSFMLSSNGLPGLDPRMLSPASLPGRIGSGGGIRRRFSLRKIGEGNRFRLRTPVPAASFLLQQLFNAALTPVPTSPGGILDLVAAIAVRWPLWAVSRSWPRKRWVPSERPRRSSSFGAAWSFSFTVWDMEGFSFTLGITDHLYFFFIL